MPAFLVDEDLPRSLVTSLRQRGHEALDVRDVGLRGRPDNEVFAHAQDRALTLITGDLGFANEVLFPPEQHHGVVLGRFPNSTPAQMIVSQISDGLDASLGGLLASSDGTLRGFIIVIEPGQIRFRLFKPRA